MVSVLVRDKDSRFVIQELVGHQSSGNMSKGIFGFTMAGMFQIAERD
jgi:hypothetical protein